MDIVMVILLVALSGIFSGLTLGLFSLSPHELARKIELDDRDAQLAKKIYPVRKDGNLLLCTLLLGNVAVNSALSIFLGNITSGVLGGLIATGLIVIFGEIIPQAAFSRYALQVGAKTAWLVKIFMFVLYPVCKPIAMVLDKALGAELPNIYGIKELGLILEEHQKDDSSEIDEDDARIAIGALTYSKKQLKDIMVPLKKVFMVDSDTIITKESMLEMKQCSYNFVPVFEPKNRDAIGIFKISQLIGMTGEEKLRVKDLLLPQLFLVLEGELFLDKAMENFLNRRCSLAIIHDKHGTFIGVVSLEDIMEEILQLEILDDDDVE